MAPEDRDIERRTPAIARSFDRLRDKMNPEARERVDQRVRDALREMTLQKLRRNASDKTQIELEELLELIQGSIFQLEGRQDVLLSKLAKCIHAMGGDLELVARFPDADIRICQFEQEDEGRMVAGG